MSIYVLKRKLDNKTRHNTVNASGGGFKLAVTNTGVNKSKCSSDYAKTPIVQQSYRNLYKRRLRYFVEPKTTFKRMPESSTKQHIDNIKSNAINDTIQIPLNSTSITKTSIVNVINSGGNKYVFNNSSNYDSNQKWSLTNGTYILKNVPQMHPIAILNSGNNNIISYKGDSNKKSTKTITGTTADGSYDFYYGDVTVTVNGNFGNVSIYCFNHGYMGGENLLVYVEPKQSPKMLSAGDQIARVKARRICKCTNYEMEISGNSASKSVCP